MPAAFRLIGRLNVSALEKSLNELVKRHETLRTTFSMIEGEPVQTISPSLTITIPLIDLTQEAEHDQLQQAQQRASLEAQKPFDLAHGPLLRAILLRIGTEDHILVLTLHHIVSDGWSWEVGWQI